MERRSFGRTDLKVSVLGFGTAEVGFRATDEKTIDSLLGAGAEAGINVIDTASMYAGAEEALGRVLRQKRKHFLLFTKCGRHVPRLGFPGRVARRVRRSVLRMLRQPPIEWQPSTLTWNIEESLRRLKTDTIDLIQLHSCTTDVLQRGDVIRALQDARDAGKVRYVGYSGDGGTASWAVDSGCFDSLQLSVNIADQQALDDIVPRALARGMGIIAKRPIANAVWKNCRRPADPHMHAYWDRLRILDYGFLHDEEGIAAALRFTMATGVHTAIVGTTNPANMQANILAARSGCMSAVEYEAIRARWKRIACSDWTGQM